MASTRVVLPWSTCATMAMLRRRGRAPRVAEDGSAGAAKVEVLTSQGSPPRGPPIPGGGNPVAVAVPIRPLTGPDNPPPAAGVAKVTRHRPRTPTTAAHARLRVAPRTDWRCGGAPHRLPVWRRRTDVRARARRDRTDGRRGPRRTALPPCGVDRPPGRGGQRRAARPRRASSDPAEGGRAAGHVTADLGEHGVWSFGKITPGDVDDRPALRDERGPPPCGRLDVPRIHRLGPARGEDGDPRDRERGVDGAARRRAPRPSSRTRPPRAAARAARAAPRPPTAPRPHAAGGPPRPLPASRVADVGRVHLGEGHRPAEGVVEERGPAAAELDRRVEHRQRGRGDGEPAMHLQSCAASSRRTTSAPGRRRSRRRRPTVRPPRPAAARPPCRTTRRRPGRRDARPHLPRAAQRGRAPRRRGRQPDASARRSVGEVHARVERLPPAGLHPVVDRVAADARRQRLGSADHARLLGEEVVEGHAALDEDGRTAVPPRGADVRRCERPSRLTAGVRRGRRARPGRRRSSRRCPAPPRPATAARRVRGPAARASRARAGDVHPQHACVDRQVGAEPARREHLRAQLLPALADDRGGLGLTRLHAAAGQLPPSGHRGRSGALGGQHPTVADDRRSDDDRLGGHRGDARRSSVRARASRPRRRARSRSGSTAQPAGADQRTSSCTSVS